MGILILIIAIIAVIYRKYKGSILKAIWKIMLKTAAVAISLTLVLAVVIADLCESLLNRISKEEQR